MSRTTRFIVGTVLAALSTAPLGASAAGLRSVACSANVDYLLNGVVRSAYQKDFVITPGVAYSDDFSSATRLRVFDASTRLEADRKTTTVSFAYFNDVGVFETIDFATELQLRDDKAPASTSARHTYWSSLGVAGDHTTDYVFTCEVLKD